MPMDKPTGTDMEALRQVMRALRDPQGGCPWDLEQDFKSVVPHTLEEAYEVAETIESGDMTELCDELGDLLFQVVFYAQMAEEQRLFCFEDIAAAIVDKLIRRHPHVFGDVEVGSSEEQTKAWELQKARERADKKRGDKKPGDQTSKDFVSALAGVSRALPSLTRAAKLQRRAARVGFEVSNQPAVMGKPEARIAQLHELAATSSQADMEDELGDLLFTVVKLARQQDVDPERALRSANRRFESCFGQLEKQVNREGGALQDMAENEWQRRWQEASKIVSDES